jgi:hypothetical protein
MGDDVMHLTGDACPFGGGSNERLLLALSLEALGALSDSGQPATAGPEVRPEEERSGHQAGEEHEGAGPAPGKAPAKRRHDGPHLDQGRPSGSDDPRSVAGEGVKGHEKGNVADHFNPDDPLDQGDQSDDGEDGYGVTTPPDKRHDECHLDSPTAEPGTGPVNEPGDAEDGDGQGDARIGDYGVGVGQSRTQLP